MTARVSQLLPLQKKTLHAQKICPDLSRVLTDVTHGPNTNIEFYYQRAEENLTNPINEQRRLIKSSYTHVKYTSISSELLELSDCGI